MEHIVELILRVQSAWNVLTGRSWGDVGSYKYHVWCDAEAWRCTRCDGRMNTIVGPRGTAKYTHQCINLNDKPRFSGRRHSALLRRIRAGSRAS